MTFKLQDNIVFAYKFYTCFRTMTWIHVVHSETYKDGTMCGKNCYMIHRSLYTSKQCIILQTLTYQYTYTWLHNSILLLISKIDLLLHISDNLNNGFISTLWFGIKTFIKDVLNCTRLPQCLNYRRVSNCSM